MSALEPFPCPKCKRVIPLAADVWRNQSTLEVACSITCRTVSFDGVWELVPATTIARLRQGVAA